VKEPTLRIEPPWLITDDYTDTDLGTLKAGKEAQVSLLLRECGQRSCLLVHKRYIPLSVQKGQLQDAGFSRARTFTQDAVYWDDKRMSRRAHREKRAMANRTTYGRTLLFGAWSGLEYANLSRLWRAGVPVPFPVEHGDDSVVMEYVGDRDQAAPQLVQAHLDAVALRDAHRQWMAAMRLMVGEGLVHGDLSPFNILWWDGRLIIIDLPQAVDLLGHPKGFEMLHRDVANVGTWFSRKGIAVDADAAFADLLGSV
jgi:RIO kinase 1